MFKKIFCGCEWKSVVLPVFVTNLSLVADLRPTAEGQLCSGDVHICAQGAGGQRS